jgi:mannose-6-phosphate isomerase-like protein (cupin superfamily)
MTDLVSDLDWETLTSFQKCVPFRPGEERHPTVVKRRDAVLSSWGPDPEGRHRTPCWVHTTTETIGFVCTMSVAPGDYFEVGNHPNVETYYQMAGVLHVTNADTGQVCEVRPGDGFIMPAYQYHIGYNFSTEESLTLACVPGETHTPEFRANPLLAANYGRDPVALFGGSRANDGWPSYLGRLREWPAVAGPPAHPTDFTVVRASDRLQVVLGDDPRSALLASFYYSTPQLAAYSVVVPPNRIGVAHTLSGETVVHVTRRNVIVCVLDSGTALYAEEGDTVFIPPGVAFQYQNRVDEPVELQVITAPWEGATLVTS